MMGQWKEGTAGDFLGLSDSEAAIIEAQVLLAQRLRELRTARGITQAELARRLNTRQSSIARMEAASQVTLDMLTKALLECGATLADVAQVFCEAGESVSEVRATDERKLVFAE